MAKSIIKMLLKTLSKPMNTVSSFYQTRTQKEETLRKALSKSLSQRPRTSYMNTTNASKTLTLKLSEYLKSRNGTKKT